MTQNNTTILKKLWQIQKAIRTLEHDKKRDVGGVSYTYTSDDKLFSVVRPLMDEVGVLLHHEIIGIENTRQDYNTNAGKAKSEILSTVHMKFTWICCETGEFLEGHFSANGMNDWDKGVGSALAYGERYYVEQFFHIKKGKDSYDKSINNPAPETPSPATNQQKTIKPNNPSSTLTQPSVKIPQLPELTMSEINEWNRAVDFLVNGGKIEKIREKYVVTKPNEELLKKKALERVA
ncbi:ERF family protein [Emticicia sp. BO119]|uniref:ERF family protein n=1 Tax=Emticicia sp. BO119 TaxID=2757768 RepID=UPI0015F0A09D|nr:ERF family protein [Emticicia sp. BO119]MBA4852034.1 ERF family protein [Emticicia sp. BO119]